MLSTAAGYIGKRKIIHMAGKLNQYGNFGEIREGWIADLVLINGEPLEDITILEDPDSSLALIMKQGEIVKNRPLMIDSRGEIKTNFQKPTGRSLDAFQLPKPALPMHCSATARDKKTG